MIPHPLALLVLLFYPVSYFRNMSVSHSIFHLYKNSYSIDSPYSVLPLCDKVKALIVIAREGAFNWYGARETLSARDTSGEPR